MRKNFLFVLLITLVCACNKNEDPEPTIDYNGKVVMLIEDIETSAFDLINELELEVLAVWIYDCIACSADNLSDEKLNSKMLELQKKPYLGYYNFNSRDCISISLNKMHVKEYQQEWLSLRKDLNLTNKGTAVEYLFKVPVGTESLWIDKLKEYPLVKEAYRLTPPCEVKY